MSLIKLPIPIFVDDAKDMRALCAEVRKRKVFALDTETTGKNLMVDHVVVFSLCYDLDSRYCLSRRMLPILAEELAEDPSLTWVMHNANFDRCMLANSGVPDIKGSVHCTIIMHWLFDENLLHGLKEIAKNRYKIQARSFKSVFGIKGKESDVGKALLDLLEKDPENVWDYASLDAWLTLLLYQDMREELAKMPSAHPDLSLLDLFEDVEVPYIELLFKLIRRGIIVDSAYLEEISYTVSKAIDEMQWEFNKVAGRVININSSDQLRSLFIDQLKYPIIKKTKGGASGNRKASMDSETLEKYAEKFDCKLAKMAIRHAKVSKILSTYCKGIVQRVHHDRAIHASLIQTQVTGRLSARDPNLLAIPRPDEDEFLIRDAFISDFYDFAFVAADYSQLEMRLLADLAGEENMIQVIKEGKDIHMGTAALMNDIPYEKFVEAKNASKELEKKGIPKVKWPREILDLMLKRQAAKGIGFGINYGEGDAKLAASLGISVEDAKEYKERYFKPYPRIREFVQETQAFARKNLYVTTLLHRYRRLYEADADWKKGFYSRKGEYVPERPGPLAARALRQAVNSRIQGSAADIAKMAQLSCDRDEQLQDWGVIHILQIHDELLFYVPKTILAPAMQRIKSIMEAPLSIVRDLLGVDPPELKVPLQVDIKGGFSWAEAH